MEAISFSKSARRTFHDVNYVLTISGDNDSLNIEVEHAEDGRRWRSQFAANFIEDITKKTGNVKKFDVFVRMALSALAQESDAVYLDILTARDLEMLRRHANPQGPPTTSTAGQSDKRYLILTYRAEFDKVHYPLPLPLDERSEEEMLRAMVNRLRADLGEARQTIARLEQDSARGGSTQASMPAAREDERVSALQRQNSELSDQLRVAKREVEQLRSELRLRGSAPAAAGAADSAEMRRLRETCGRQQAELKSLKEESRQKGLASKREVDQATKELRMAKQSVDRLQAQVRKLEDEKRAMGMKLQNASRGPSVDRSRPQSRTPSVERGRTPSRPASRNPPSRPPSRPASRPTSRANSRASSVASSRDRTPSPSSFLDRRGPRNSAETRPWAFQRGNSPNAGPAGRRQVHSPGSTLSPYTRPPANIPAARRTPSPGQRSRERTPSPGQRVGAGAGHPAAAGAGRRSALSLREPRSGEPGTSAYPSAASALAGAGRVAKPAAASRYNSGRPGSATRGREQAADAPARAGSYGAGARLGAGGAAGSSDDGSGSQHRPGSLFGLAANLGLGPGSLAMGAGGGPAGVAGAAGPPVVASSGSDAEVDACDIDARLQALQSFLKQTKTMTG
mmetsp:Transcript_72832/g.126418  ORF Transcript_72832/g.126418 Transcript_72832/m.126418 type:complete len:625 (+) Transcript_72832:89-1963(+)